MKKLIISTFLTALAISYSTAQIENLIPKNAVLVIAVNAKQIKEKLDTTIFNQLSFIQNRKEKIKNYGYNNPEAILYQLIDENDSTGLSTNENWYFFINTTDSYSTFSGLIPLEDKDKGMTIINNLIGRGFEMENTTTHKKYSTYSTRKSESIAWNDSYVLISSVSIPRAAITNSDHYYEQKDSLSQIALSEINNSIFSGKSKNSITKNEAFQLKLAENHDAFIWMDSENLSLENSLPRYLKKYSAYLKSTLKGSFISLDFNENNITSDFEITVDDETLALIKNLNNSTINPILGKYIDKEKASAVFNSSMNIEALIPFYKKAFLNAAQLESHLAPISEDIYALYDLVIDQEAVLKLWGGDFALAYEGMTDQIIEYASYEYDEEYNSTKVTIKDTIEVPQLVYLMTTDDPQHVQRIINIIDHSAPVVIKEKGYYEVAYHKTLYYFALVDNVLIITNIKDRVTKHLNGLPSQSQYKFDTKYNTYANVDFQKAIKPFIQAYKEEYHSEEYDFGHALIDFASFATYSGTSFDGNNIKSSMKISIQNTKGGSFTTFWSMIDKYAQYRQESRISNRNIKSSYNYERAAIEPILAEEAPAEWAEEEAVYEAETEAATEEVYETEAEAVAEEEAIDDTADYEVVEEEAK